MRKHRQADKGVGVKVGVGAVGAGEGVAVEGGAQRDGADGVLDLEALDLEVDARLERLLSDMPPLETPHEAARRHVLEDEAAAAAALEAAA